MFACHNFNQFLELIDRLTIDFCTETVAWESMAPHDCMIWCRSFLTTMVVVMAVIASQGVMAMNSDGADLDSSFYEDKCPGVQLVVQHGVEAAMQRDPRMPASLLRLHFHDCFVNVRIHRIGLNYITSPLIPVIEEIFGHKRLTF